MVVYVFLWLATEAKFEDYFFFLNKYTEFISLSFWEVFAPIYGETCLLCDYSRYGEPPEKLDACL